MVVTEEETEAKEAKEAAERGEADGENVPKDGYRENLAMAKQLATDDPRVVANVVKAWVGANE